MYDELLELSATSDEYLEWIARNFVNLLFHLLILVMPYSQQHQKNKLLCFDNYYYARAMDSSHSGYILSVLQLSVLACCLK